MGRSWRVACERLGEKFIKTKAGLKKYNLLPQASWSRMSPPHVMKSLFCKKFTNCGSVKVVLNSLSETEEKLQHKKSEPLELCCILMFV